jgi:hypothetical protein
VFRRRDGFESTSVIPSLLLFAVSAELYVPLMADTVMANLVPGVGMRASRKSRAAATVGNAFDVLSRWRRRRS